MISHSFDGSIAEPLKDFVAITVLADNVADYLLYSKKNSEFSPACTFTRKIMIEARRQYQTSLCDFQAFKNYADF